MSKAKEHLDAWLKEIAPSTDLRKAFGHDPKKWDFFKKRVQRDRKEIITTFILLFDLVLQLRSLVNAQLTIKIHTKIVRIDPSTGSGQTVKENL